MFQVYESASSSKIVSDDFDQIQDNSNYSFSIMLFELSAFHRAVSIKGE